MIYINLNLRAGNPVVDELKREDEMKLNILGLNTRTLFSEKNKSALEIVLE